MALLKERAQACQLSIWKYCKHILEVWASLHVEFHGIYSENRIRQLHTYSNNLTTTRLILICLLTPVPCVLLSLASDSVPLAPLNAGMASNWFVFVRAWVLMGLIGAAVLVQIGMGVPQLKLNSRQITFVALLAATVATIFIVLVCALTIFPIPFGSLAVAPPQVFTIAAGFIYLSGSKLRANPSLWIEVKRQLSVFNCQVALTFVYPLYIFGYISLSGYAQTFFVLVSPVIQLIAKNWMSRELSNHHDIKPETIVLTVEIFNALYVSNALQSASSWKTTLLVIGTDCLQLCFAMLDITEYLHEIKALLSKIPHGHPVAKENFVQIAERLMDTEIKPVLSAIPNSSVSSWQAKIKAWVKFSSTNSPVQRAATMKLKRSRDPKSIIYRQARVFPIYPPQHRHHLDGANSEACAVPELAVEAIFTREERALFIQKTAQVLFITEYVILVEYIEVTMPLAFSIHRLVLFHMPNHAYYPSLASCTNPELYSSIMNVMVYVSLEFLSLVIIVVVLKRTLGFSALSQLAFVLEKHASTVQMKIVTNFVYIMQTTLIHVGLDFSFKFAWLQNK